MIASLMFTSAMAGTQAALSTTARLPRSVIKPGEPVHLYLAMKNRTDRKLSFEKHARGACFTAKFVAVRLSPPAPLRDLPDCTAAVSNVGPGEVVEFLVDLREVFELEERQYSIQVEWRDGGPDIYSPLSARVGQIRFQAPFYDDRLAKGDPLYLPDKNTLVFRGHQSQPAERKGDSPTIVMDFLHQVRGEGDIEALVPVKLDETRQFDFGGYRFDVLHHQFDQWMQLRIYE